MPCMAPRKEAQRGEVIVLMPRRGDMSREDFQQYLRETHLPLAAKVPGLRRLVVNWVLPDPKGPPPGYTPWSRTGSRTV
jgi:hypothetical protein